MNINNRKSQHTMKVGSYDYQGLAHWWVYNHGYKSTAVGRMSVDGNTVYSYRTPIAKMLPPRKGSKEPVILIDSKSCWSNTTQTHIRAIKSACSHLEIIEVVDLDSHLKTLERYTIKQTELAQSYPRKRKERTKESVLREMRQNTLHVERLASYFKLKRSKEYKAFKRIPLPTTDNFEETLKTVISKSTKIAEAAKRAVKRKQQKQNEKRIAQAKDNLAKWFNGENVSVNMSMLGLSPKLRIKGDMIETTSKGTLPLKVARVFFKKYQEGKLKEGQHISSYMFRGVSNGIARIGCHRVELTEIERVLAE